MTQAERDLIENYKASFPDCEVAPYFPRVGNEIVYQYERGQKIGQLLFGRRMPQGHHIHHVLGSANGAARENVVTNIMHVSTTAHDWLETHKVAGQVLCFWIKRQKGELNWAELTRIKGKRLPGWISTDDVIEKCVQFPFIEKMRQQLVDQT